MCLIGTIHRVTAVKRPGTQDIETAPWLLPGRRTQVFPLVDSPPDSGSGLGRE